jgi:hypothetical protein
MLVRIGLLSALFCLAQISFCQTQASFNRMVSLIREVPARYSGSYWEKKQVPPPLTKDDIWFEAIVKYDTTAIPYLIELINDSSLTKVINLCTKQPYRTGDLATLLIIDIESIPSALVTHMQWCTWGQCGILPDGFLEYVHSDRQRFKVLYQSYYRSKERRRFLQSLKKGKALASRAK